MEQLLTKLQGVDTETLAAAAVAAIVIVALLWDHFRAKNHGDYFHDFRGAGHTQESTRLKPVKE